MNIALVAGARPNFMKLAPLMRGIETLRQQGSPIDYTLVYTGPSDDSQLESSIFTDLKIHEPDVYLGVDCQNLNELTGQVMAKFDEWLAEHPVDTVVVVDDLASTMAVAIVTKKRGIRLAHIAAGTRSFDINMPKEINRLVIDGLSDVLFTAGISNNSIANREGAELSKVYMVGNILMDNLRLLHDDIEAAWQRHADDFASRGLGDIEAGHYLVLTINRKALLARPNVVQSLIATISLTAGGMPVIAPLRGLARKVVEPMAKASPIRIVEPLPYLAFGWLTAHAAGIITDSGNVAEEASFNQVPAITLNSYTEHIETVKVGTNVLVDEDPAQLQKRLIELTSGRWKKSGVPERWDGRTAERILQILAMGR